MATYISAKYDPLSQVLGPFSFEPSRWLGIGLSIAMDRMQHANRWQDVLLCNMPTTKYQIQNKTKKTSQLCDLCPWTLVQSLNYILCRLPSPTYPYFQGHFHDQLFLIYDDKVKALDNRWRDGIIT